MNLNQLAKTATLAGELLLKNGAETYRVEDTMNRICSQYGATIVDSFATPTLLIVSFSYQDQLIHNIKRIHQRSVDLNKIDKINDLSRNIITRNITLEELNDALNGINKEERYSTIVTLFFASLCTFGFAFFFQGSLKDAISALFVGFIIKAITMFLEKLELNGFFVNTIGGALATLIAMALYHLQWADSLDKVIISSIMLLVPGLAITNAIRDTVSGDLLSGMSRTIEAFLVAVAIALGSGAIFMLLGGF